MFLPKSIRLIPFLRFQQSPKRISISRTNLEGWSALQADNCAPDLCRLTNLRQIEAENVAHVVENDTLAYNEIRH